MEFSYYESSLSNMNEHRRHIRPVEPRPVEPKPKPKPPVPPVLPPTPPTPPTPPAPPINGIMDAAILARERRNLYLMSVESFWKHNRIHGVRGMPYGATVVTTPFKMGGAAPYGQYSPPKRI